MFAKATESMGKTGQQLWIVQKLSSSGRKMIDGT
jgi:hypothetical protein